MADQPLIPLTTNVRRNQGFPPAVTSIILFTLYLEICADHPNFLYVVLLPLAILPLYLFHRHRANQRFKSSAPTAILSLFLLLAFGLSTRLSQEGPLLSPVFDYFVPLFFRVVFRAGEPDPVDCVLSLFSHADLLHWLGNMVYLWIFGSILEDRIGWKKFLLLFLACGLFGNFLFWAFNFLFYTRAGVQGWDAGCLGSSGTIFGIQGLAMFRFYQARVRFFGGVPFLPGWAPFAIPLWVFTLYGFLYEVVRLCYYNAQDHVSHIAHIGGFLAGWVLAYWLNLSKENELEIKSANAKALLSEGAYQMAEEEYRNLFHHDPGNEEVRTGLAESLFEQSIRGIRKDRKKKGEALQHFFWLLDLYIREDRAMEAVALYKRLLGPYSVEEIGEKYNFLVESWARQVGEVIVQDAGTLAQSRQKLHLDFLSLAATGKYPRAQTVLSAILKKEELRDLEPSFLFQAGETALRVEDCSLAERLFEAVARRGDLPQTVRALDVLSRYWLKGRRHQELALLYRQSAQRFTSIDLYPEWVELGRKLRE